MPPKKVKDNSTAPVYGMPHEEQVQLLSDALLREYMHRRGFLATLKAFDQEHPRDEKTISSRALMSDLMALQPDEQQRMKADGIETIMEMLCNLRVERRMGVEKLTAEAEMPLPKVPAKYEVLKERVAEREARMQEKQQHKETKKSTTAAHEGGNRKKAKGHSSPSPALRGGSGTAGTDAGAGMTIDDLLGSSHSSNSSSGNSKGSRDADEEDEEDESEENSDAAEDELRSHNSLAGKLSRGAKGKLSSGTSGGSGSSAAVSSTPKAAAAAPAQPAWMEMTRKKKKSAAEESSGESDAEQGEEDDTDGGSDDSEDQASDDLGGDALPSDLRDQLSAAFQLLCGFDGSLPRSFLEQGFSFDDALDCALIQWRPGSCDAVIAPVQGFVAAYYYEKEVYTRKSQHQQDCLLRALCSLLEQAQPNYAKIVLLDGHWKLGKGETRFTRSQLRTQASSPRTRCWTQMQSAKEVRAALSDILLSDDRWAQLRGCGALSFLFSILLSHGVDAVQKELSTVATSSSGERPSLLSMSADGHATLALTNLVLTGKATAYRHNGVQHGSQLGYSSKLKCGLLCGDDTSADADATLPATSYSHAMDPVMPSWVLWHKHCFANLYMTKDTRPVSQQKLNLGGSATDELVYWDAAKGDDVIKLSVTVRSITFGSGTGGVRNAKSFVNTAITSVPAWSTAEVNWNGDAPLRD